MINTTPQNDQDLYYRLISLWVLCEAFAGGILHAFKLPFTGLIVSSLSVLCIILIASTVKMRYAIIKATLLVCIFKLMLSPHSPPTAYIAVLFQGFTGSVLLSSPRFIKPAAIIFGIIALAESALQRIGVLVLVYGNNFWKAIDLYLERLLGPVENFNYSLGIAILYVLVHALVGSAIGYYGIFLTRKAITWKQNPKYQISEILPAPVQQKIKKKKSRYIPLLIWAVLLYLLIIGYNRPEEALISSGSAIAIILRAGFILITWYFIISPFVMKWIFKKLMKEKEKNKKAILVISSMLPITKGIIIKAWEMNKGYSGSAKYREIVKIILVNIMYFPSGKFLNNSDIHK